MKIDYFEQSHSAEKCERGPLGFSNIYYVLKCQKNEGGTLWYNQILFEKSLIVPKKNQVKNAQIAKVGNLGCFRGSGLRLYNFG